MSAVISYKDSARINLRTSPEAKALIERAAAIMGSTVSGFMLQNAYEAASRIVLQRELITLSDTDRDAFLDAIQQPVQPTKELIELMRNAEKFDVFQSAK